MNYSNVEDLAWVNPEHTMFNCTVDFEGIGVVEFSCSNTDTAQHSQNIWSRAMAGDFGVIAEYVPPPPEPENTATPPSGNMPSSVL
jgi:hypothetical protein